MAGRYIQGPDGKMRGSRALPASKKPRSSGKSSELAVKEKPSRPAVEELYEAYESGLTQAEKITGRKRPPAKMEYLGKTTLSSEDHYIQDALEKCMVWHLQKLAEKRRVARNKSAAQLEADYDEHLESRGLNREALIANEKGSKYLTAIEQAAPHFLTQLMEHYPEARFSFRFTGLETISEGGKGDIEVIVQSPSFRNPKHISLSLKNYVKSPNRVQLGSGTFQSFAFCFFVTKNGKRYVSPLDGSERGPSARDFRQWRDNILRETGNAHLLPHFNKLDTIHDNMRKAILSDQFAMENPEEFAKISKHAGTEGAKSIVKILNTLPQQDLRKEILRRIGLDGKSEILAIGDGKIVDSINDKKFRKTLTRIRSADIKLEAVGQRVKATFTHEGETVLDLDFPCGVNANGAWFAEGTPWRGKRYHPKEKKRLAYGERRPSKSRQVSTSVNAYADLGKINAVHDIPGAREDS